MQGLVNFFRMDRILDIRIFFTKVCDNLIFRIIEAWKRSIEAFKIRYFRNIKCLFFFFLSKYNLHNFTSNICHDDNKKLLLHSVPFSELKWIDNIDRFFSIYKKKN